LALLETKWDLLTAGAVAEEGTDNLELYLRLPTAAFKA
jgi:hypothetical protein